MGDWGSSTSASPLLANHAPAAAGDKGCAYGATPVLMTYDGDHLDVEPVPLSGRPLHYLLVDLQGSKSTTAILQGLQSGFPTPTVMAPAGPWWGPTRHPRRRGWGRAQTDVQRGVHALLGPVNQALTAAACAALRAGDAPRLGALMTEAQVQRRGPGTGASGRPLLCAPLGRV